jgi:hypothetical protein
MSPRSHLINTCEHIRPRGKSRGGAEERIEEWRIPIVAGRASCGGPLAAIEDPAVARKILDSLGLPSRPPPVAPARRNRHLEIAEL